MCVCVHARACVHACCVCVCVYVHACMCAHTSVLNHMFAQIEEVALVTDKGSTRRRGFIFVTYLTEDSVDKCTEIPFHVVGESRVSQRHSPCVISRVYLVCLC